MEKTLRFGLPYLIETSTVQQAVALCERLGLHFVELNSNFPACGLNELAALPLREMAGRHGVFFTLHVDDRFDPFDFNPLVREAYTQTMLSAITLAKASGIRLINMHIPRGNIVTLPSGPRYLYEEYEQSFTEAVTRFGERCQQAAGEGDVRIAIENTTYWAPHELRAIERLLQSPVFSLCLDTGHDHAENNRDLPFILHHRDRLAHMHLHDGHGKTNHQALGIGEIPLSERLTLAAQSGATVVLEVKTIAALEQSVHWLRAEGWL